MNTILTVESHFDAGHIVSWHPKCGRLHGHTYRVVVSCEGPIDEASGLYIDFGVLKKDVRRVVDLYDHKFIVSAKLRDEKYSMGGELVSRITWGKYYSLYIPKGDVVYLSNEATAENIAYDIRTQLGYDPSRVRVQVFEGAGKSASTT